jgi:hypothetical protein
VSLQIRELLLYSRRGEVRRLPFRLGALNVITGGSGTGKSAIINVVDYCLGAKGCSIPARVVRDAVRWYAILLQLRDCQVFVARAVPVPPRSTNSDIYVEVGESVTPPPMDRLVANTNPDALNEYLTRMMGISPNLHIPPEGQTREPLQATLRHAKAFAFQYQDEIANKDHLFHGQHDNWVEQAIKDTLPYFLGAVPEDQLKLQHELREERRRLRQLERRLQEAEAVRGADASRAAGLLREAQAVALLPAGDLPAEVNGMIEMLRSVQFTPSGHQQAQLGDQIRRLRQERARLQQEYDRVQREMAEAEEFAAEGEGFVKVATEQRLRLESLNLFSGEETEANRCPLCRSEVDSQLPQVEQVQQAIDRLKQHVQAVGRERPDLREFIASRSGELTRLGEQLRANRDTLQGLQAQDAQRQSEQGRDLERMRVVGKVEMFLEGVTTAAEDSELRRQVGEARRRVEELTRQLQEDESEDILRSSLNVVSQQVTRSCEVLKLEYGQFPLRLDLPKLTLVADTGRGPVPMQQMGSGQNWLWCHLTVYFALHKWFIEHGRPVPRFLILDQPTQVYYPSDKDAEGSLNVLGDSDRAWVIRLFRWINERLAELKGGLQVIVTDHAEVDEPWFGEAVVERWRNGKALVPADWPME